MATFHAAIASVRLSDGPDMEIDFRVYPENESEQEGWNPANADPTVVLAARDPFERYLVNGGSGWQVLYTTDDGDPNRLTSVLFPY